MSDNEMEEDGMIEIEEVEMMELDPSELSQFVPVSDEPGPSSRQSVTKRHPLPSTSSVSSAPSESETDDENPVQREMWIKKFVAGEISYTEYQSKMQQNEEPDEEEGIINRKRFRKSTGFEKDYSTARRDALKGNLQGPSHVKIEGKQSMRRQKRFLPPALQGLMGEANLCYARGDVEMARSLCLEIIRQVPLAYEPFVTLSQIFENEDSDKFLQFSLIAAHLNPSDVQQWIRIAEMSDERGNIDQALTCYSRAIKADPRNFDLRMRRARLLEKKGDEKQAFKCYFAMIPYIPKEQGEFLIETAKRIAKKFHEENNIASALDAMQRAYKTVPERFTVQDVNLLLELLIAIGSYRVALDVLMAHTNVELHEKMTDPTQPMLDICRVIIPENMILDFRTKLGVVLVHLKCRHLFDVIIADVLQHINVEEAGDCYLDIAEALMKEEFYHYALKLLVPLINSVNFSLAAVWLRYADCLRSIKDFNEAIRAYRKVVTLAQHLDARLTLSALLKQQSRYTEALKALEQDPEKELLDPELLHERSLMLKEVQRYDEFLESGFTLLARHCIRLQSRQEMGTAVSQLRFYEICKNLVEIQKERKSNNYEESMPEFVQGNELPVETEWELFLNLLRTSYKLSNYTYFQKLVFMMHTAKRFQHYRSELQTLALVACIYNHDPTFGYNLIRDQIRSILHSNRKVINSPRLWNVFNLVILVAGDFRYHRYLSRLFERVPDIKIQPRILMANYHLNSGTYKYALNEYNKIFLATNEPVYAMMVAITLTQIACQKFTAKKQALVAQAISFMERYREGRPQELHHEVYYNFGRMYHQLGLLHLAVDYYKKVLNFRDELVQDNWPLLNLQAEAAYNLSCIYRHTGNNELARKYLYEYIRV